jgi:DNA-binding Xre family transcriptional regulator
MKPAISFAVPKGEEMVILSRRAYDALVESAELGGDLQAIADYRKKHARGEEEAIPAPFANRLIDGDNPVRVYRDLRGLSARELAERSGISPAFLSGIETGKKGGGIATLKKIAQVLNVGLDDLVVEKD